MPQFLKRVLPFPFLNSFDKRQRFAVQTLILTSGLLITQLIWEDYRFFMVGVLGVFSYFLTAWSLKEDIKGTEWILLFILPVIFTMSVSLFYFLLPPRWIIRLIIGIIFAVGTYASLLIENIYNVAVTRTIGLLRAAQSIGLLLTLVILFLGSNIIFSIRASFWLNMLMLMPLVFLLALQSIWSVNLEVRISKKIFMYSFVTSLVIGEEALVLSFWPVQTPVASLFLSASYYTVVGIFQQYILDRLFTTTIREYLLVFMFTSLILLLTTKWG